MSTGGPATSGGPVTGSGPVTGAPAWVVAFVGSAVVGVALMANVASGRPILAGRWSLLGELAVAGGAWAAGVVAAFHLPRRAALPAVVLVALALRVAALAGPPTTSDDLYRYSWDGRVQAAGTDPYAQPPDSPRLAGLREGWLWPDAAGCAAIHRPPGCTRLNRPPDRTIYPPVAEGWFAAIYRLAGVGARAKSWQVAGMLTELGALAVIVVGLRRWGRDDRWVALYALCPAAALELVNNGHVDGLAILLTAAALAVVVPPARAPGRIPGVWRDVAFGALVGGAALVKLYPVLLLVAVVGTPRGRRLPALARAGAAAGVVAAAGYLPHVVAVGPKVLGYLPDYLREEHYDKGGRFLLANAVGIPARWAGPVSALVLAGAVAWVVARRPPAPDAACALMGTLFLTVTPVQPWYAVSLVAVAAIAARPAWVAVVVAGYPYFFAVILDSSQAVGIGQLAYGTAGAVVVLGALVHRWRGTRRAGSRSQEQTGHEGTGPQGSMNCTTPSAVPATTT